MAFQVVSSKVDLLQSSQDIPDIATLHLKIEALDNEGEVEGLLYDDFVGNTYTSEYLLPFIKQTNTTIRYTFECDTEGLFVNLIDTQIALSLNYNKGYSVVYDANGADEGDVPQNQFKKPGESVQLASKPSLIKDRYTLDNPECGWSTVPVYFDEGIDYAFGDVYATDSDVVLYVKWHQNKFNIIANIADDTVFKGTINGGTADIPHINLPEGTKYLLNSENNVLTIYDNDGNVIDEIQAVFDPGDLLKPHAGNISWENLVKDKLTTVTYDIDASVGFYGKLYTYTLDQLVEASNDLAANGTASKYYKEFSIYVKHTFDRT